jgi:hypothetical protein
MNCGAAIYGVLKDDTTLTGLLSSNTAIFPDVAPQGTLNPCIVYSESIAEFSDTKDGVSTLDVNVIQIDIYSTTIVQRAAISSRVRTLLDRYSGTKNSIVIDSIKLIYSVPTVENYNDTTDLKVYRQSMDFQVRQKI